MTQGESDLSGDEYNVHEWGRATNLRKAVSRELQGRFKNWESFRLQTPDGTVMDDASYLTKAHTAMLDGTARDRRLYVVFSVADHDVGIEAAPPVELRLAGETQI